MLPVLVTMSPLSAAAPVASSVPLLVIGAPEMAAPPVSCTVSSSTMLPPVVSLIWLAGNRDIVERELGAEP